VDAATPGPWEFRNGYCYQLNEEFDDALWKAAPLHPDAAFIALSRTLLPLLVDVARAAETAVENHKAYVTLLNGKDCPPWVAIQFGYITQALAALERYQPENK